MYSVELYALYDCIVLRGFSLSVAFMFFPVLTSRRNLFLGSTISAPLDIKLLSSYIAAWALVGVQEE
jgi:hypothetical protein